MTDDTDDTTAAFGHHWARDWVAVILAIALGTALNLLTFAVLYDAIFSEGPGLSENATQIMTGTFGGIIGVLGAFLGYRAGTATAAASPPPKEPTDDTATR